MRTADNSVDIRFDSRFKFYGSYDPSWNAYSLWLKQLSRVHGDGGDRIVVGVEFKTEPYEPEGRHINPPLQLDPTEAQNLLDVLWDAGLRPTGAKDPSGELAATKYHLEDMRKLALK